MGDWLDGWARRAARSKDEPTSAASSLSRRQLLKRAGVVAGAAWTVPLIRTALAPPASASPGCAPNCVNGTSCVSSIECASGYCNPTTHLCATSGKGWATSGCSQDSDCWSDVCGNNNRCEAGDLSAPCRTAADCKSDVNCSTTTYTCGGTGASCTNDNKCVQQLSVDRRVLLASSQVGRPTVRRGS